jgi:hypothetical protein
MLCIDTNVTHFSHTGPMPWSRKVMSILGTISFILSIHLHLNRPCHTLSPHDSRGTDRSHGLQPPHPFILLMALQPV